MTLHVLIAPAPLALDPGVALELEELDAAGMETFGTPLDPTGFGEGGTFPGFFPGVADVGEAFNELLSGAAAAVLAWASNC